MAKKISKKNEKNVPLMGYPPQIARMIEQKAYTIWETMGRPQNSAVADWLQAEKELREQGLI